MAYTKELYTRVVVREPRRRTVYKVVDRNGVEQFRSYKEADAKQKQMELNNEWKPIAA